MSNKFAWLAVLWLASCAVKETARLAQPDPEIVRKIGEADLLSRKGNYVALRQAVQLYGGIYARPEFRKEIAPKLAAAALVLAAREKELGISNKSSLEAALRVIKEYRSLAALTPYAEIVGLFWVQGKGVMADIDERFPWRATEDRLKNAEADLHLKARASEFFAYMYAVMKCYSAPVFGFQAFEGKDELDELAELFPDSLLLLYKRAICPQEKPDLLRALLAAEPQFFEAYYFLGNEALKRGNLLEAEELLLKAYEPIPESPQTTILLGSIYLATEELERSLDFFERTLALNPEYRDALLGKAVCLSYMGRPADAIAVCQRIIELGHWLIGESYYWTAWNQHELGDNLSAAESIDQSKSRLPTSSEVFTLSGTIALEKGELAKAEKDLKEALQYNPANAEARLQLGSLYAQKKDWPKSGDNFEKAAFMYQDAAAELEAKIADLEKSKLAADRKNLLLRRKAGQLEKAVLTKATAFYNAAAGYFNAGQRFKALEMATRSAEHPAFKEKADKLASGIK